MYHDGRIGHYWPGRARGLGWVPGAPKAIELRWHARQHRGAVVLQSLPAFHRARRLCWDLLHRCGRLHCNQVKKDHWFYWSMIFAALNGNDSRRSATMIYELEDWILTEWFCSNIYSGMFYCFLLYHFVISNAFSEFFMSVILYFRFHKNNARHIDRYLSYGSHIDNHFHYNSTMKTLTVSYSGESSLLTSQSSHLTLWWHHQVLCM